MASAAVPSACASVNITRLYTGQRSIDEVSIIMWDPSGTPRFEKLDDTALPQNKLQVQRVEFLPGAHTFTIRVANDNTNGSLVTITRETSAGHCYLLRKEIMAVSVDVSGQVVA